MASLFEGIDALTTDGDYSVITDYATIPVEFLKISGNTQYSTSQNIGNATADERMLAIKYDGDLTIDSGVIITPSVRKRGLFLIVEGDCNIAGALSMSARGANTSVESYPSLASDERNPRILILVDGGTGYEILSVGGDGGIGRLNIDYNTGRPGNPGGDGVNGGSGGGGSGGTFARYSNNAESGDGAQGTTFSGGSGSGAAWSYSSYTKSEDAQPYGARGGNAAQSGGSCGGGGGNPTGLRDYDSEQGAGGLLILVTKGSLTISGTIEANGSKGGASDVTGTRPGGAGSGGGSVNIFYQGTLNNAGILQATGGLGNALRGTAQKGGDGGDGTVRVINVSFTPTPTTPSRRYAQFI